MCCTDCARSDDNARSVDTVSEWMEFERPDEPTEVWPMKSVGVRALNGETPPALIRDTAAAAGPRMDPDEEEEFSSGLG